MEDMNETKEITNKKDSKILITPKAEGLVNQRESKGKKEKKKKGEEEGKGKLHLHSTSK